MVARSIGASLGPVPNCLQWIERSLGSGDSKTHLVVIVARTVQVTCCRARAIDTSSIASAAFYMVPILRGEIEWIYLIIWPVAIPVILDPLGDITVHII